MARLIGFAWNKSAYRCVDISAFDLTGIFRLNRIRVPEYFFSISNTSETVPFMENTHPDMAPIWNQLSVLPVSAETALSFLNSTQCSDTSAEEFTLSRLL
jgi:hypothetical protein